MSTSRFIQPRDLLGRFAKFESDVNNLMKSEAQQYAHEVADYMQANYLRKRDSTGRLASVTLDRRNRIITPTTWRVGIPGFLDQSSAKYWRLIEQGSAGLYAGGQGFRGTPLRFIGDGPNPPRPFRSFPNRQNNGKFGRVVEVKNEIRAMHAYRKTFLAGEWQARIRRDLRQSVGKNFPV